MLKNVTKALNTVSDCVLIRSYLVSHGMEYLCEPMANLCPPTQYIRHLYMQAPKPHMWLQPIHLQINASAFNINKQTSELNNNSQKGKLFYLQLYQQYSTTSFQEDLQAMRVRGRSVHRVATDWSRSGNIFSLSTTSQIQLTTTRSNFHYNKL